MLKLSSRVPNIPDRSFNTETYLVIAQRVHAVLCFESLSVDCYLLYILMTRKEGRGRQDERCSDTIYPVFPCLLFRAKHPHDGQPTGPPGHLIAINDLPLHITT